MAEEKQENIQQFSQLAPQDQALQYDEISEKELDVVAGGALETIPEEPEDDDIGDLPIQGTEEPPSDDSDGSSLPSAFFPEEPPAEGGLAPAPTGEPPAPEEAPDDLPIQGTDELPAPEDD